MKTKEVIERVRGLDLSRCPFNEIQTLINEFDGYPYESFANDLQKARVSSAKYQYVCCLPGCNQKALKHSHIYKGGVYDEELEGCKYLLRRQDASIARLYESICNDDFSHYYFTCVELDYIGLAVCDALVDEGDLAMYCESDVYSEPLKILYVHLLPKGNHSYLILGYDTRSVTNQQKMQLDNWAKALDKRTDLKVIYDILCHCSNNWCISPDCDERIIKYLEQNYSSGKMNVMLGECLDND